MEAVDPGQGIPHRREMLERSLAPLLLRLAWPVLISMLLHTLFNFINAMWVGRLGPESLAAVTTAIFATWTLIGLAEMVATGLVAVIARHVGAGEGDQADRAAGQGIVLAFLLSGALALASPWAAQALFGLLHTPPGVAEEGVRYLRPLLLGALPLLLMINLEAILRAWGDTRTPMRIALAAVGLNLVLDPFLIFGWGPFPALGVRGAALATILAHSLGTLLFVLHFRRQRHRFPHLLRHARRVDLAVMVRLIRIGAPATLNTILFSAVYLLLSRVASQLGTGELATLGVGNRLESFSFLTSNSLSAAVATLVGQNLGAALPFRARHAARVGMQLGCLVSGTIGLGFFAGGEWMFAAFTGDPTVRHLGGEYMKVLALCQPFMGIEIVLFGAFAGAGYTQAPSWISALISIARIPLAFLVALTLGLGLAGLAWVISLTCMLRAGCLLLLYRRGRWLHVTV